VAFVDKTLKCRECGVEFVFSAGEQQFYASRGLLNEPRRCPACRAARRAAQSGEAAGYGNSGPASRSRERHTVICAECGARTEVPFVPRNDRPVYCSACYNRLRARR